MDLAWAVLLGALQGLTEWLPISSSGHLVIVQRIISHESVLFDAMVHGGTLLAVVVTFRWDVVRLVRGLFSLPLSLLPGRSLGSEAKLAWYTIVGTLPVVVVGLILADEIEAAFSNPKVAAVGFIITGFLLLATKDSRGNRPLDLKSSLAVGLVQAAAVMPGISRSGSTISVGLISGVDREEAVTFSFLLSVPAISGALVLEVLRAHPHEVISPVNVVGFLTSFMVGIMAIRTLLAVVRRGKLHWFSFYCLALGLVVLTLMS